MLSDKQDYVNSDIYLQTVTVISNILIFYIIIAICHYFVIKVITIYFVNVKPMDDAPGI